MDTLFEEIQNDLHDKGKQQTINVFNNNTRNLIFKVNEKQDIEQEMKEEQEECSMDIKMTNTSPIKRYMDSNNALVAII